MRKLLVFISIVLFSVSFVQAQTNGYKPGDNAIDFKLKSTDGKVYSLADLNKGKGFIVIFTCNHCPFSQAYEQRIIALHKKYAPKGMPVVAINPNDPIREPEDSYDNMKKRAKKYKYPFVYLVDENQSIAKAYGAMRTPHVYVLDAIRNVVYIGAIDDNFEDSKLVKEKYLENVLDAFLSGKPILNPVTKAIGCGIKWKK
jgi:peroxiredoxin